jgi:hypothetical protein
MKPATKADITAALARAFLDRLPESDDLPESGEISRPALGTAVSKALARDGLTLGPRKIYAIADAHPRLVGPYKRQNVFYYRVRPLP